MRSTGPRTAGGKDVSRLNAVKHGLRAETDLLPGEDPGAYAALITALSFGNVFFQIPIGWIADKVGKNRMMIVCFVLAIAGLIALPFSVTSFWV